MAWIRGVAVESEIIAKTKLEQSEPPRQLALPAHGSKVPGRVVRSFQVGSRAIMKILDTEIM